MASIRSGLAAAPCLHLVSRTTTHSEATVLLDFLEVFCILSMYLGTLMTDDKNSIEEESSTALFFSVRRNVPRSDPLAG